MKSAAAPDWVNIIRHSTFVSIYYNLLQYYLQHSQHVVVNHGEWLELLGRRQ